MSQASETTIQRITISERCRAGGGHIKHLFEEGELSQVVVVRNFRTTESNGKNYNYIVDYRIKSCINKKGDGK